MNFVADAKIGEQVTTDIVRSGKAMKLKIKISEKNDGLTAKNQPQRQSRPQGQKAPHGFGLELADLNSFSAREFGIPPFVKKGVVIVGVEEGSLAEQAGLNPGDVILDVNRTPVSTTSQALQAFQKDFKKGSSGVKSLRIQRGPNTMVVFVELE
jgi:serine protease Do